MSRKFKSVKKAKVSIRIQNNPKNINKNILINFDPDFTEAYSGEGGVGIN